MENLTEVTTQSVLTMNQEEFIKLLRGDSIPEFYADQSLFRALVQMIPAVGPLFDAALAIPGTKSKQQRLDLLLWLMYKGLILIEQRLSTAEIDAGRGWMTTETFEDMVNAAIESAQKSRSREKILLNSMILTNLINGTTDGVYSPEEYINVLNDLTPLEIKAILVFYRLYKDDIMSPGENILGQANRIQAQEILAQELSVDNDELEFIMKRLERTGFIKEINGTYLSYFGGRFTITKTLLRLMDYLRDHPFSNYSF
ncbi:MAG: hypothetical protein P4L59_19670 [Desulfosporosinus sp.]|nr:hypothetical protein [Desulfosporosinus sp.]